MKRVVAFAAMLLLTLPAAPRANAQAAVYCVNCSTLFQQVQQFATEISNLESQLQQQITMVQRLESSLNPMSYATQLEQLQQPFSQAGQLTSAFSNWHTSATAYPGSATFLNNNTLYRPQGTDAQATELNNNSQGLANIQAMMAEVTQSINSHIAGLDALRGQLSSVTSTADLTALNGRISAETADIQAQGTQVASLQTQLLAEEAVMQQRALQQVRQADDDLGRALGNASVSAPGQSSYAIAAGN